jgi:hypothetical protein
VLPPVDAAVTANDAVAVRSVKPLADAVTVSVAVDVAAVAPAVTVSAEVSAATALIDAVTPAGAPLTATVMAPANPPVRVIVSLDFTAAPPPVTASDVGESAIVNAPAGATAATVRANDAVWSVTPAPFARTVMLLVAAAAVVATVNVIDDDVALAPIELGLADSVTPAGRPSTLMSTAPANPPVREMLAVTVPVAPAVTEADELASDSVMAGVGVVTGGGVVVESDEEPPHAASAASTVTDTSLRIEIV